jgi:hypothetical protein
MELDVKLIPIDDLTLDPNNARKHSERNLDAIAKSLLKFGQRKPIVVDKNLTVIAGNGTVEAARSLGWKGLNTVCVPKDWDSDTIKAYALADNRTAELASWDGEILIDQLKDLVLNDWNVNDFGFKDFDLKDPEDRETGMQHIAEQYEVVIQCADEDEQTALLLRLSQEGLRVRAIVI